MGTAVQLMIPFDELLILWPRPSNNAVFIAPQPRIEGAAEQWRSKCGQGDTAPVRTVSPVPPPLKLVER